MTVELDPLLGQVKSRLLPLSPMASALEWLIERLPRRLIRVGLKPDNHVVVINESKGEYKATGNAPSFELTFVPMSSRGAWYYLEAALVRHNGSRETYIVADIRGNKERFTIPISTNLRGTVREVIYLPANIIALHWFPTAAPGLFSQSQLLLHRISPIESILRRVTRVLFDYWRFKGSASAFHAGLIGLLAIGNLQDAYQRTATLRIKRLTGNNYSAFIALNDILKKADIRAMRKQLSQLPLQPIISLIMPVNDPIEGFFLAAIDSVFGQIYPHWELLLVGDITSDQNIHIIANEQLGKSGRVKVITVQPGTDTAAAFNIALEQAQGEFVFRLDQHDLVPPHALFLLAREISKHPDAELIYTDDDSINDTNQRIDPRFKPDWNPELFFSYNYLGKLTLYRQARVLDLGGYRPGFEGAEDYDLSLRYLKDVPASRIRHIPKILYHSRTTGQPLASIPSPPRERGGERGEGSGAAHQSGKRALEAYFEGSGTIVVDGPAPGLYHIKYPLPAQLPLVSIIIPTRDRADILRACITSIQQKTDYENWEMLVVDNQSVESDTLDYFKIIKSDSRIKIIRYEKPFNYGAMNNYATQYAKGEILALLNNDVEVIAEEWLTEMVGHVLRPGVGAVGAKLLYSNGTVQHAGVILGLGGVAGHAHKYLKGDDHGYCHRAVVAQNLSAVTGACLVVKKKHYQEVGGLNETELVVALSDVDFCLKLLAAGYRNVFTPYALLYHHESISRGIDDTPDKHALFIRESEYMKKTWGKMLQQDSAYNPNLTQEFEDFSFNLAISNNCL
jgi:glycosyltransferase involved in cell wall biosynthesis